MVFKTIKANQSDTLLERFRGGSLKASVDGVGISMNTMWSSSRSVVIVPVFECVVAICLTANLQMGANAGRYGARSSKLPNGSYPDPNKQQAHTLHNTVKGGCDDEPA
ncbi:unnamed protein product [Thlaspi arvense]|uniref:Uncharacterized protein n=1 Tax=Thlaspi arvense TaxID=13288 RepID=A0AAU9T4U4_THLAR|nr:unnamed protein product [Thlaspi arvense]